MQLTTAQKATLKTWLDANAAGLNDEDAAALLNTVASPNYHVWRSNVTRTQVYKTFPSEGTSWNWATFKGQTVAEQGTWTELFMGGCDFTALNNRDGVFRIFSGNTAANNQRAHIFNVGRRLATVGEKLFAVAVVSGGGITASVDNGNTLSDARGAATRPDIFGLGENGAYLEGDITAANVSEARQP